MEQTVSPRRLRYGVWPLAFPVFFTCFKIDRKDPPMSTPLPNRRGLKARAKRLMLSPLSLRVTLAVVGAALAFFLLRLLLNGTLSFTMASLAQFGDTTSGIYVLDEGINLIFRMDLTGTVAALSVTYAQLRVFLLVNLVFFLLLSPLRAGAMEAYWKVTAGQRQGTVAGLLAWFTQPARLVKAWVVQFCLQVGVGALTFVASTPAMYQFYQFYSTTANWGSYTLSRQMVLWSADCLAVLAMLFGVWLHSLLLPVLYCLAAHPEYSLKETFRRGFRSAQGIRGGFYRMRLSFLLWFFLSRLTYGAMDFFVLPYSSLTAMLYLQEGARLRARQGQEPAEEETDALAEDIGDAAWPPVADTASWPEDDTPVETAGSGPEDELPAEAPDNWPEDDTPGETPDNREDDGAPADDAWASDPAPDGGPDTDEPQDTPSLWENWEREGEDRP